MIQSNFTYGSYYSFFCYSTVIICEHTWSALFETELLRYLSNGFLTVIRDHAGWSLTKSQFAVTKLTVLDFQRKNSPLFLPNERPFKSNCTVRVGVILNNQTGLALTIHFHLPNTESGLHVNNLVCLWHELCSKFHFA